MPKFDVSVVIGFRDWGAERIRRSAQSILAGFNGLSGEVIISDYGSTDPEPARRVASDIGAKHVYTAGDPNWSRARALNAGFAIAEGQLLISTDADMLFSPESMRVIVETSKEAGNCALFLQCRDLPSDMGDDYFSNGLAIDWEYLESRSRLRPRWGMGGMMAIDTSGYLAIRGFDERLHTYGGEDLDFAQRARRAGYRTVWVDDPKARMFHMWHPPTIKTVEQSEEGKRAVAFNKDVVYNDKSYIRNLTKWRHAPSHRPPLVSVVYSTRNRSELLKESIKSVLLQTIQDFEIVVVDDGPDDNTTQLAVESLADDRIRYFRQERAGISAARNLALEHSRGQFTAVMDDDDLMPPRRLEWQLSVITSEYVGSCGSFVNFDDTTGERALIISRKPRLSQAVEKGGAPGHGTWLLKTDVMRTLQYDTSITSGIDNNMFLRLLRSGYKVAHCGKPVLLRRRHAEQVTALDGTNQSEAAKQALQFLRSKLTEADIKRLAEVGKVDSWPDTQPREVMLAEVEAFLPDHLVVRDAAVELESVPDTLPSFDGEPQVVLLERDGVRVQSHLKVSRASYGDLAKMCLVGEGLSATIHQPCNQRPAIHSWLADVVQDYRNVTQTNGLIYVRRDVEPQSDSTEGTRYRLNDGKTVHEVVLSHSVNPDTVGLDVWLVIGSSAEEVWA